MSTVLTILKLKPHILVKNFKIHNFQKSFSSNKAFSKSILKTNAIKSFRNFKSKPFARKCTSLLVVGNILNASIFTLNDEDDQEQVKTVDKNIEKVFEEIDSDYKRSNWYQFVKEYLLPEIGALFCAVICALGSAAINIRIPSLLGNVINILNENVNQGLTLMDYYNILKLPVQNIALNYILQGLLTCSYITLLSRVGENISCELRRDLFRSLLQQDIEFFDQAKSGEIIERITSDVQDFKSSFKLCISQGLKSITQTTGCVISMYSISPKLTFLMAGVIPILVGIGSTIGSMLRKLSRSAQDKTSEATGIAGEAISNIRTVRAFAMEHIEDEKFYEELLNASFLNQMLGFGIGLFQGATNIALNGIVLGMIYSGGYLVSNNEMNPGELMSFLVASQIIQRSLASVSILFGTAVRGASAANRVFEYINMKPQMSLTGGKKIPFHCLLGDIEFKNVTFAYSSRPDNDVLKSIFLKIPRCKVVALCGLSGSGKSTIANLIERFYDPTSGVITLDGHDLKTLDASWLRRRAIGYINQEPILFATTIEENIKYGKPEATFDEVEAAAKLANADTFIRGFTDGYQTVVGERGCQLSGGQKQRIAIARALIKNPAILILDEATSALDSDSEKLVQEALNNVMVGRTVVVIAHRLSTIQTADHIVVISNGQIIEQGTHRNLKAKRGVYAKLIDQQAML